MMRNSSGKDDFLKWKGKKRFHKKKNKEVAIKSWMEDARQVDTLTKQYDDFDHSKAEGFDDYPLCTKTKNGLKSCGFLNPTAIQKASILPALKQKDVLGAAKTGSGKTLSFVIPILECLHRHRWNSMDGPGALVISPTRELALQIFEVICKVGCKHDFSAGLVIGGKNVKEEAERVCRTNIVVCTPGRLLQHLDTTSYFQLGNLKMLVLDEADRILDLGFSSTINAIIENLPSQRQTLLFSATQTKSVKDLARLSLTEPVYISVHAESRHSTPSGLVQRYVECPLSDKLNMLFSFIKNHLKTKTLVFVSSCKQVQFLYAAFCLLRPGVPIMHLHGNLNQVRRLAVYQEFCRKKYALLIATDLASRGLDFPAVDWVIQVDCPEDAETYIHRVGRTARFHGSGNAMLLLLPSEKDAFLEQLKTKKVPIEKSKINLTKLTKIDARLQSFCAQDQELKEKAKRCFVAYFKSTHLMKNKSIFKVKELPKQEFATSLGLAFPPRIRFLQKIEKHTSEAQRSIIEKMKPEGTDACGPLHGQDVMKSGFNASDDETDLFTVRKEDKNVADDVDVKIDETVDKSKGARNTKKRTKAKEAKRLQKKGLKVNTKIVFSEEGNVESSWPPSYADVIASSSAKQDEDGETEGLDINQAQLLMKSRDIEDRKNERIKIAARHRETRLKAKDERRHAQMKRSHSNLYEDDGESITSDEDKSPCIDNDLDSFQPVSKRRKPSPSVDDEEHEFIEHVEETESSSMTLQEQEDLVLQLLNK